MKEFLRKIKRWQAVAVIVTAIATIALVVIAVLQSVGTEKPEDTIKPVPEDTVKPVPEEQTVWLPDPNYIWKLNIDNALLAELYGKAHGLAITQFQDAKLRGLSIVVNPYWTGSRVAIIFTFYSQWADRICEYHVSETSDVSEIKPSKPANSDWDRVTFDEEPWLRDPGWPQFLRKAWEKASPLSADDGTYYVLFANAAFEPQWRITFYDGVTGNNFRFSWDGQGDPILKE